MPLVVMLHGCTQNPDDFAAGTCMNEAALKRGFYVLYPSQTQHANSSRCWNWFKHNHQKRGRGEPALLAGMTRDVMKRYNIDPQRDIEFVLGPVDSLDHASRLPDFGSKMGIDATRKWPQEGFTRRWPDVLEMKPEVKARVAELWKQAGLP